MSRIQITHLRPVGFELFQDSETFLDELCEGWELDSVNHEVSGLVISYAIGLQIFPIGTPTKPDCLLNASILKEDLPSFIS